MSKIEGYLGIQILYIENHTIYITNLGTNLGSK